MVYKLFLFNLALMAHTSHITTMYKSNRITQMLCNKICLRTCFRNIHYHLRYKTPEGIVIKEHWNGSEIRIYPNGKIIHTDQNIKTSDQKTFFMTKTIHQPESLKK